MRNEKDLDDVIRSYGYVPYLSLILFGLKFSFIGLILVYFGLIL